MVVIALSISRQIEQIGAISGLAAVLGLAVLSLLYFAQAREVKRLREWAGRSPERDAELQQRVAEDAARRAAAPAGAARTAPASAAPPANAASVPATAAAQKVAPVVPAAPAPPAAPGPAPGEAAPAAPAAVAQTPAPSAPSNPAPQPAARPAEAGPTVPPVRRLPGAPAAAAGAQPRPRRTVQVGSGGTASVPATAPAGREQERRRVFSAPAVAATVLAAALVAAALFLTGVVGGGRQGSTTSPAAPTGVPAPASGVPAPADTTVAVLNGTTITGLARQAADRLQARKYSVVRITDAADQAQQTSQVAYAEGFDGSARRIARLVGIAPGQVVPLDASTRAVAGDSASVVITMGADKAQ